jgi:molybdate transport system regulatory protein
VSSKSSIRFSFRVYHGDKPYLGNGRIELIQLIHKHGSIAKAADAMSMSYRKAWQMVKDLNKISKQTMIDVKLGGKKGGGAMVTEAGLDAVKKFLAIKSKAESLFTKSLTESEL